MRQVCDLSIHLQPRENTTTVPQPRYYSNKNWSWMTSMARLKVFFGGQNRHFSGFLGAVSQQAFRGNQNKTKSPKTSMLFLTFLHFGDRKRSFSLTFQISIVFFWGWGDLFGGVKRLPLVTSGKWRPSELAAICKLRSWYSLGWCPPPRIPVA